LSDIQEEQAKAIREATARAGRSDSETIVHIGRMTEHSHCPVCRAVHDMATDCAGEAARKAGG
jgi:hypothetical protein